MNFDQVIRQVVGALDAHGVRYALIGGFAMALRGVQRATMDLDFILMLEDLGKADEIITGCGYRRVFHSANVSHYVSPAEDWGRIDILHAFRGPTLGMLNRAEAIPLWDGLSIRVVHVEDIIGLKVQASVNDPARAERDWGDIRLLLESAGEKGAIVDWTLLTDYLELFGLGAKLVDLKGYYGATQ
jgi:predicted nucleotidyltransferase